MDETVPPGAAVAVADRIPVFRRGLVAALAERGIPALELYEEPGGEVYAAVVVAVREESDRALLFDVVEKQRPAPVIAVLPQPTPHAYAEVLGCGVQAAVSEAEPIEELVAVVEAALEGRTRLPSEVVRVLAAPRRPGADIPPLTEEEASWLRGLAAGVTVAALAERSAYSERELHRRLARLYQRLGVHGRAEAVVLATKWGIVD